MIQEYGIKWWEHAKELTQSWMCPPTCFFTFSFLPFFLCLCYLHINLLNTAYTFKVPWREQYSNTEAMCSNLRILLDTAATKLSVLLPLVRSTRKVSGQMPSHSWWKDRTLPLCLKQHFQYYATAIVNSEWHVRKTACLGGTNATGIRSLGRLPHHVPRIVCVVDKTGGNYCRLTPRQQQLVPRDSRRASPWKRLLCASHPLSPRHFGVGTRSHRRV